MYHRTLLMSFRLRGVTFKNGNFHTNLISQNFFKLFLLIRLKYIEFSHYILLVPLRKMLFKLLLHSTFTCTKLVTYLFQ